MKFVVLILSLAVSYNIDAQIELSSDSDAVKEEKKREKVSGNKGKKSNSTVDAILYSTWSASNRLLKMNDAPYGDSLLNRVDEAGLNTWSFGIGIRSKHGNYFAWEGSIAYIRNGESYLYENSDSSYSYNTTYAYIGMPFNAYFTYSFNNISLFAGGGLSPQIFSGYRQDVHYKDSANHEFDETFKTKSGYNPYVISASAIAGIDLNLGKSISVFVFPEYRWQLISSYEKIDDYKHFARAFNIKFGISYKL